MMKQAITFTIILLLGLSCSSKETKNSLSKKEAHAKKRLIENYKAQANVIIKGTESGMSSKKVLSLALNLIEIAVPILKSFQKSHPDCTDILQQVIDHSSVMTTLDLNTIERDYHDGEALIEAPEHCYEGKELIVHPATVAIIAKKSYSESGKEQIVDEIEEVLAHIHHLL